MIKEEENVETTPYSQSKLYGKKAGFGDGMCAALSTRHILLQLNSKDNKVNHVQVALKSEDNYVNSLKIQDEGNGYHRALCPAIIKCRLNAQETIDTRIPVSKFSNLYFTKYYEKY